MAIEFYKEFGDLGYLANYSNHGFYKNGIYYKTVEHYYQSEKYDNEEIKQRIIDANTPKEASNIGRDRNNIRKNNFKEIKQEVMLEGLVEKFRQNKDILYKLLNTKNEDIMEHTVDEYYWGIGKDYSGKNIIGSLLCKTRNILKNELLNRIILNCSNDVYILANNSIDSIVSSYLLCNILSKYDIKSYYCVMNNIDILNIKPEVITSTNNKQFILVDTDYLNNIDSNQIIGIITSDKININKGNIINILYSSTSLLIYDLFKDKYDFSNDEIKLIIVAILYKTKNLSFNFDLEDEKLYKMLLKNI